MNKIFLVVSVVFLFACQHEAKEIPKNNEKHQDNNVTANISLDTASILGKELGKALKDPAIDNYFIQIFNQGRLIRHSDDRMLSITDSLFSKDADKDFFYFLVFTKSIDVITINLVRDIKNESGSNWSL